MRTVWTAGSAAITTGTTIAAACAVRAVTNAPARSVAYSPTVTSAAPVTQIWKVVPNVVCVMIAPQPTVGIVLTVMGATTSWKMSFAAYVGAVPPVWAAFATVAASARNARNPITCTVLSAVTATPPSQTARRDTITARNAVSSASSAMNVYLRTASIFARIAVSAFTAV